MAYGKCQCKYCNCNCIGSCLKQTANVNLVYTGVFFMSHQCKYAIYKGGFRKETASVNTFTLAIFSLGPHFFSIGACSLQTACEENHWYKKNRFCTSGIECMHTMSILLKTNAQQLICKIKITMCHDSILENIYHGTLSS